MLLTYACTFDCFVVVILPCKAMTGFFVACHNLIADSGAAHQHVSALQNSIQVQGVQQVGQHTIPQEEMLQKRQDALRQIAQSAQRRRDVSRLAAVTDVS